MTICISTVTQIIFICDYFSCFQHFLFNDYEAHIYETSTLYFSIIDIKMSKIPHVNMNVYNYDCSNFSLSIKNIQAPGYCVLKISRT